MCQPLAASDKCQTCEDGQIDELSHKTEQTATCVSHLPFRTNARHVMINKCNNYLTRLMHATSDKCQSCDTPKANCSLTPHPARAHQLPHLQRPHHDQVGLEYQNQHVQEHRLGHEGQ